MFCPYFVVHAYNILMGRNLDDNVPSWPKSCANCVSVFKKDDLFQFFALWNMIFLHKSTFAYID